MGQHLMDLEEEKVKANGKLEYLTGGIEAKGHALIYKMHKYFARRPHNVFHNLVHHYSNRGDVVLDVFCGGGVTVYEALSLERKVIGCDINPLATFITRCQTTKVPISEYMAAMNEIYSKVKSFAEPMFSTQCRETNKSAAVRWNELAYVVICPSCGKKTSLANSYKAMRDGKERHGKYACLKCREEFNAVDARRESEQLVQVIYKHPVTKKRIKAEPNQADIKLYDRIKKDYDKLVSKEKLWIPNDVIPAEWDRQQEDCLHRKGIERFSDLFTARNLLITAYYYKVTESYRRKVSKELYEILLFTFSATLRHTSNMTISTENWMDGRPAAWTKHAFWLPNQFVEANPLEYIEKRVSAIKSGLNFQKKTLLKSSRVDSYSALSKEGTHIVWTKSSANLELPNESIDLIVTDPPYGSNVQYGELCSFWLVWLKKELGLGKDMLDLSNEILVNRKSKNKDYKFYNEMLFKVFEECYRVLKWERPLVFTFNNKDFRAWCAVIEAVVRAGFQLDKRGLIYQDAVENYKNTAHLRFNGSLHGDIIYTFVKSKRIKGIRSARLLDAETVNIEQTIINRVREILSGGKQLKTSEVYVAVLLDVIPRLVNAAKREESFDKLLGRLEQNNFESILRQNFKCEKGAGEWALR